LYKLISIAFIISFLGIGCSVLRKASPSEDFTDESTEDSVVLKRVERNNFSQGGYFIKSADIEVNTENQRDHIVATVRFSHAGGYLISLKSRAGIEAVRVFIGRDTLMINDRINKVLYASDPGYIERRFFIPELVFPLIFGDFVKMSAGEKTDSVCSDGKLNYISNTVNMSVSYVIDCKLSKTVKAFVDAGSGKGRITLLYYDFKKAGDLTYPRKIEVSGLPDKMTVKIVVNSIEFPWIGDINFVPGNRYEILRLK